MIISGRSGLDPRRAGIAATGRRLANRPRPFLMARSPCSGLGASGSLATASSHLGPPTAPRRTPSTERQLSRTSSVRAMPCSSIDTPPIRCSSKEKPPRESSTSRVASTISGPIPSPGSRAIRSPTAGSADPDGVGAARPAGSGLESFDRIEFREREGDVIEAAE